jgi:hypothetical protein
VAAQAVEVAALRLVVQLAGATAVRFRDAMAEAEAAYRLLASLDRVVTGTTVRLPADITQLLRATPPDCDHPAGTKQAPHATRQHGTAAPVAQSYDNPSAVILTSATKKLQCFAPPAPSRAGVTSRTQLVLHRLRCGEAGTRRPLCALHQRTEGAGPPSPGPQHVQGGVKRTNVKNRGNGPVALCAVA